MSDLHSLNEAINKRAGRKLIPSIGVGIAILTLVIGSLSFFDRVLFLALALAFVYRGIWEMDRALSRANISICNSLYLTATIIFLAAWFEGIAGIAVSTAITIPFTLVAILTRGPKDFVRNAFASIFTLAYIPFLASFLLVMAKEEDGLRRIMTLVALVACNDTFGYIFGVLLGKHRIAPAISPKKSWEGLVGSILFTGLGGSLMLSTYFDQPWWVGALVGLGAVVTATSGDFIESAIKRDLDLKDMGALLPGHGGVLDRLDSVLLTSPFVWAILNLVS
ncbi:MAG: phosphatidate cytidylyltransferase [Candidatus Nanopelagicaceae bacterium]